MDENEKLEAFEVELMKAARTLFMLTDAESYLRVLSVSFEKMVGSRFFIEQDSKFRVEMSSDYNAMISFFNEMKSIQKEWQKERDSVTSH